MMETKRRREQRSMLPVHPDAAAIDIGATVHVAAVGPARDPEPVRSFGTFTGDAWWRMQSGSNPSQHPNSLITGKITGNFENSDPREQSSLPIGRKIQTVTIKFPTQRNTELLEAEQGIF